MEIFANDFQTVIDWFCKNGSFKYMKTPTIKPEKVAGGRRTENSALKYIAKWPAVVACTCNAATLEAEFRNGVGLIPVGDNSPSIGGWIV